jgi:hypothetical protein
MTSSPGATWPTIAARSRAADGGELDEGRGRTRRGLALLVVPRRAGVHRLPRQGLGPATASCSRCSSSSRSSRDSRGSRFCAGARAPDAPSRIGTPRKSAAVGDREPKDGDRLPMGSDDEPCRAVDDGGPAVGQEGGAVREHLLRHLGGAANEPRSPAGRGQPASVGAEDNVGVQDGDERGEVALACGRQERSDDRSLSAQIGVRVRCGASDAAPGAACKLACRDRRPPDDRPTMGAISTKGRANMSCNTNTNRSAGPSVSRTTSSARPIESATSASCLGSSLLLIVTTGSGSQEPT